MANIQDYVVLVNKYIVIYIYSLVLFVELFQRQAGIDAFLTIYVLAWG